MSSRHRPRPKASLQTCRPVPTATALIQCDGKPIRDKIKKEYDRTQAKLRKARDELEAFNGTDRPSFDRWYHGNLGALLTRLRECQHQTAEAESLVREIEAESFLTGCSLAEAYRIVLRRREHPESPPDPSRNGGRANDPTAGSAQDEDDAAFEEEAEIFFEELFSDLFGEEAFGGRRRGSGGRRGEGGGAKRSKEQGNARSRPVKELYRELARRLHPDRHRDLSGQRLEWWHQVQAAYAAGDTEQLEIILALCEIEDAGHTRTTSLSLLQRITRQLKKALRELQAQLGRLRREPAWNFSKRTDLEALKTKLTIELESELHFIQRQLQEFQKIVEDLKRKAARPARKGRKSHASRRRRVDPLEYYFA